MSQTERNAFLKGTAWVSISNLFFLAIGYVVQILIGRALSPSEYGTFGIAIYILNIIEYILMTGLSQSLSKFLAERPATGGSVLRYAVYAQIVLIFVLFIPVWIFAPSIAAWFGDTRMIPLLHIIAIILPFYSIRGLLQGILVGQKEFASVSKVKILIAISKFVLVIAALLLNAKPSTILLAYLISSLFGAIYGWQKIKHIERTETIQAKAFYRYSFSLTVFLVVFPLFINVDVFLVKKLISANETVGLYVAATTLARMPFYLFTGLLLTLLPSVASLKATAHEQLQRMVREVNRYALLLLFPLTVLVILTSNALLPALFGAKYDGGGAALSVLVVSVSALVLFQIFSTIVVGITTPSRIMFVTLGMIALSIGLNIVLTPHLGILGAALSSLAASAIGLIIASRELRKFGLLLFDMRSMKNAAIASGVAGILVISHPKNILLLPYLGFAAVVYFGVLFMLHEVQEKDIMRVRILTRRKDAQDPDTAHET